MTGTPFPGNLRVLVGRGFCREAVRIPPVYVGESLAIKMLEERV